MEGQNQGNPSKVVKVEQKDQWDFLVHKANDGNRAIVAHFGASWCIPSLAMNPFFEDMANNHPDVTFITIDVDDVKEVASKMEVKAMPTFVLIKDGAPVEKLVGANPEEIRKRVDNFLQTSGVDMA